MSYICSWMQVFLYSSRFHCSFIHDLHQYNSKKRDSQCLFNIAGFSRNYNTQLREKNELKRKKIILWSDFLLLMQVKREFLPAHPQGPSNRVLNNSSDWPGITALGIVFCHVTQLSFRKLFLIKYPWAPFMRKFPLHSFMSIKKSMGI